MKKLFYFVLIVAGLLLVSTLISQKSIKEEADPTILEDVVEINPELTGNEDETIIAESDEILPEEETNTAEPETIISQ